MATDALLSPPPATAGWPQHLRHATFGIVHSMATNRKPKKLDKNMHMLALLVDAVFVALLPVHAGFGWRFDQLGWLRRATLRDALVAPGDEVSFDSLFFCVALVVFAAGAGIGRLLWLYRMGTAPRGWSIRMLRALNTVVVVALYVPILQVLTTPLDCGTTKWYMHDGYNCASLGHIVLVFISVVSVAVLVPIAAVLTLFFHSADPNSSMYDAKIHGKEASYSIFSVTLFVVLSPFISQQPALIAASFLTLQAVGCYQTAMSLPYFHTSVNCLRTCMWGTCAYLALGSLVVAMIPDSEYVGEVSYYCLCCTPAAAAVCASLPLWRMRSLQARLSRLRPMIIEHLSQAQSQRARELLPPAAAVSQGYAIGSKGAVQVADDLDTTEHSVDFSKLVIPANTPAERDHQARASRAAQAHIMKGLADAVVTTYYQSMTNVLPLYSDGENKDGDKGTSGGNTPNKTVGDGVAKAVRRRSSHHEEAEARAYFDGLYARDVELLARMELSRPDSQKPSRRRWRTKRQSAPNLAGLSRAMWLFAEGIQEFADESSDIAAVKISWATYLHAFAGDLNLATSALESAHRQSPGLSGQYEIFSKMRMFQQIRQSRDIGASDQVKMVEIMDFKNRLGDALHAHLSALKRMSKAIALVTSARRKTKEADHDGDGIVTGPEAAAISGMYDGVGRMVAKAKKYQTTANTLYTRLLAEHSNVPQVATAYARFCTDVLDDPDRAAAYSVSRAGSRSESGDGSVSSGPKSTSKKAVPRPRSNAIRRLDVIFRFASLLIVGLLISMYFVSESTIKHRNHEFESHNKISETRDMVNRLTLQARQMQLWGKAFHSPELHSSITGGADEAFEHLMAERNQTLDVVREFSALTDALYRHPHVTAPRKALAKWEGSGTVPISTLVTEDTRKSERVFVTSTASVWDTVSQLQVQASLLARADVADYDDVTSKTSYRFLMDNCIESVLPALLDLANEYQVAFLDGNVIFVIEMVCFMVALYSVLLCIGAVVFRRAVAQVSEIKAGLQEAAEHIPFAIVSDMRQRLALTVNRTKRLVARLDSEGDSPRDFDENDNSDDLSGFGSVDEPGTPFAANGIEAPMRMHSGGGGPMDETAAPGRSASVREPEGLVLRASERQEAPALLPSQITSPLSRGSASSMGDDQGLLGSIVSPVALHLDAAEGARAIDADVLVEQSSAVVIMADEVGKIVRVLGPVVAVTGWESAELVGKNVTVLQPPEIRKIHHTLMKRVVEGGKPNLVGIGASHTVPLIHRSGQRRDAALGLERIEWHGETFFVATISAIADGQLNGDEDDDELDPDESAEGTSNWACSVFGRATIAMIALALAQTVATLAAILAVLHTSDFAAELDNTGRMRYLTTELAVLSQELLVGDSELYPPEDILYLIDHSLEDYLDTRVALRFGGEVHGVHLIAMANREVKNSALLFDATPDAFSQFVDPGASAFGVDTLINLYMLHVERLAVPFRNASLAERATLGLNASALLANSDFAFIAAQADTSLRSGMVESNVLVLREAIAATASIESTLAFVCVAACIVSCALYVLVFRVVARDMLSQARRTENFLELLPAKASSLPQLARYFYFPTNDG